ncbi:peptidase C14, caspase domain-containing protein [Chlamydoabsidia padenii]|nr:peptidase C14, caspase domain-containing protein [Chlamydoabsidia padenii]
MQHKPPPSYDLSNCQGRKRALLIGINYIGTSNQLNGCINDVHNIKNFLIQRFNFKEEDMVILTDDQEEDRFRPTKANIYSAMQWLVNDAQPDDSGHGGSVKDVERGEGDGYNETIYPLDFQEYEGESGQILDNELHDYLVKPLPKGCRLTAIFDSCHSGTVLDLPYVYSTKGTIKQQNLFKDAGMGLLSAGLAYASGDKDGALSSILSLGKQLYESRNNDEENREKNSSVADVVMFSGCKDDQTSADAQEAGKSTGAMSYAFITTLRENPNQSYQQLLNNVRDILRDKYAQRPQFSCSHPLDVGLEFVC